MRGTFYRVVLLSACVVGGVFSSSDPSSSDKEGARLSREEKKVKSSFFDSFMKVCREQLSAPDEWEKFMECTRKETLLKSQAQGLVWAQGNPSKIYIMQIWLTFQKSIRPLEEYVEFLEISLFGFSLPECPKNFSSFYKAACFLVYGPDSADACGLDLPDLKASEVTFDQAYRVLQECCEEIRLTRP